VNATQPVGHIRLEWEDRLIRWSNAALEMAVLYLLLSAWARPRDGQAAWLPLLACLALPAAFALRHMLESAPAPGTARLVATVLAGLAWALVAARLCAPHGYWQVDAPRAALVFGAAFGGREGSGLQPLAFWASLLLWWRGHVLLDWQPGFDEILDRFRLGCLVAGTIAALAASTDSPGSHAPVQLEEVLAIGVFFAAALVTTSLGRRREMAGGLQITRVSDSGSAPARSSLTLAPLVVIAVALLALGLAAWGAESLSPQALAPAVALAGRVLELFGAAFIWSLGQLATLWPGVTPPVSSERPIQPSPGQANPLPPFLGQLFAWFGSLILLASVAGAIAVWVFIYAAVRHALARDVEDEIRAVVGTDDNRPRPIAPRGPPTVLALFARLFRALFRQTHAATKPVAGRVMSGEARHPAVDSIRAIYQAYLAWTAQHGCPRRADETPDEFNRRLAELHPEIATQATLVTHLYVSARYGSQPCSPADLRQAQSALARLEQIFP
jgi:Domain of unknown function (DUF4129)